MKANALPVAVVSLAFGLSTACERQSGQPTAAETRAGLAALRARSGSAQPARVVHIRAAEGALVPDLAGASEAVPARVVLPARANGQIHLEDRATGTSIDIALVGAKNSVGQVVDGYVVYPKGHAWGSIYQRAEPSGVEDYLAFDGRPASPSVAYDVALGPKVAGLRLVGNQLEMLDSGGVPRLRVAPPFVVGADDALTDAFLAVEGCAVDTDPAGPWGRTMTPPGARRCRVRVSWADQAVVYPALLDPRWQTTGSLSVARQDHNLIYLPLTGKVLAVGGRSSPTSTTGLASAELFDKNTGTWSATSSMSGGRWSASATLLGSSSNGTTSQKVLIAGGINGTASLNTARLYNQTAGTWATAGTLNAPRHLHTATLLNDGRVLVCGGMNGSTVLTSAALYNPASGSGTWAATTGPIPPPGWRSGTATLIQTSNGQLNNKVLLAGGNNGTSTISAVFLFDPAQSAFSTLASMPSPREGHQAVTLSDGRILFSGGKNGSTYLASSVIFDPSWGPGSWTSAGNMTSPRWGHAMNLLPTAVLHLGLVLVSGGSNGTSTLSSTEYWNGTNWATDGAMVAPVQRHGSVALGNSILIAGGAINNGSTTVSAAEIYDPSIALGCTSGSQCASGFCVSGVCCDSACNGGCGSCNLAGHLGICTPLTSGSVCRALAGICDAAESCDGTSLACPANALLPSATVCRPSADVCDVAEACTGSSATCPADTFQASTTVCRPSTGACDIAESCTGTSANCPADQIQPAGAVCRESAGGCDVAETCTGTDVDCPPDSLLQASLECRPAAGTCDVAEACSGTSVDCPPDVVLAVGTRCRPSVGSCDPAELCDGSSGVCPADDRIVDGTSCDDQNACTANDQCQGGVCLGTSAVTCPPSSNPCAQTYCDPQSGACLTAAAEGSPCDDGDPQTTGEMCLGGRCTVPGLPPATFCAAPAIQRALLQSGATAVADTQATERKIQAHIMHQPPTAESYAYMEPVVIPVVFHLLENPNIPHIDDWQFPELLDKANALYAKMWTGTISDRSKEDTSTVPIKLVMAKRSPSACTGSGSTNGIDRVQVPGTGRFSFLPIFISDLCKDVMLWTQPDKGGVSAWDPSKYLNVWIAWEANHTFDGISNPPFDEKTQTYNTGTSCDGVTLNLNGMSTGVEGPPLRRPYVSIDEAVLVHEIGHWLGLYHLQHPNETTDTIPGVCKGAGPETCSTEGDYVCDTPASLGRAKEQACTTGQNSCTDTQCRAGSESCTDPPPDNPPDSLENYMWFIQCNGRTGFFTVHQTERMEATMAGIRSGILSSQNDIPSASGSAGDLWSRDGADDDGGEPDNKQGVVWNSNDIWVRNQDDGNQVQQHENPVYQTYESNGETKVKDVYVYVRVRNRGCQPASDTVTLRWAKASTNLVWPTSWNGSVTVPGNGAPMGGEIGVPQSTGFVQPGESKVLTFTWQPKDPSLYVGVDADKTHYCLLSTIGEVSSGSTDMIERVRAKNDIVWRNISVASDSNGGKAGFSISGVPQGDSQDLEFTEPSVADPQQSIFTWGSVLVDLKPGLFARWTAGGSFGTGIVPVSGTVVRLMGSGAAIQNIQLQPEDMFTLEVSLQPYATSTEPNRSRVDVYQLDVAQLSESNDTTQLVGGVRIALKTRRPVPLSSPPPPIP